MERHARAKTAGGVVAGGGPRAIGMTGVTKTFADSAHAAIRDFTLSVSAGEVMALLGPSGCGKTTALRLIAGLEHPDAGTIEIGGRIVCGPGAWTPPERRSAGMVFQDYALFPHLTVAGNVAFGLNGVPRAERRQRSERVLALTGLADYARRYPHELSGGQQQRVAIARAIAPRPSVVLLDEPFNNLDVGMREQVRAEVLDILRAAGVTVLLVTHDQDEAFVAAERVAVMAAGTIHQVATAEELYYHPATRFVAQFVGIANFVRARREAGALVSEVGTFAAPEGGGAAFDVLLRPEQLEIGDLGAEARVVSREFHGHDWLYVLRTPSGGELRTIAPSVAPLGVGDEVRVRARVGEAAVFAVDET